MNYYYYLSRKQAILLTRHAAPEFLRELGYEVVVDSVLERAQDDHGPRVGYGQLLHRLV